MTELTGLLIERQGERCVQHKVPQLGLRVVPRGAFRLLRFALTLGVAALPALAVIAAGPAGARELAAVEATTEASPAAGDQDKTQLGAYLATRIARSVHDTAAAVDFARATLARDPDNELLLEQGFLMEATEGQGDRTLELAKRVIAKQPNHRMANLWLGVEALRSGDYAAADGHFKSSSQSPIGELTSALGRGWVGLARGDVDSALAALDFPRQAEWAQFFVRYHRGLIADIAGRKKVARAAFERVFKSDSRTPRIAIAYARHAANSGDLKLARAILKDNIGRSAGEGHPEVRELIDELASDSAQPDLLVTNPVHGLAEVFYGLGEALSGEGGYAIGSIYLQAALRLRPDFPFAQAALANVYEGTKRYEEANAVYERIPRDTPLDAAIEMRKALNLNQLDRVDEAVDVLEDLLLRDPNDVRPLDALGSIMRARKRYEEAIGYYDRAIKLIPKPEKRHWSYWYARGTSYERIKNWPKAEADLKRALELYPDQPLVLNYLGYSWVDQSKNLDRGMALIEKAVQLKPDDGYIVDSLGWAHFKRGNFTQALSYLERAVELRPEDPILNDHLGDVYWRVGRRREARFQWTYALSLKPEPEDAERIRIKMVRGLPPVVLERPVAKRVRGAVPAKRQRTAVERQQEPVQLSR